MIQRLILGIGLICVLGGVVTMVSGAFSPATKSSMDATAARNAGIVLIVAGVCVAAFGWYIFPALVG